MESVTIPLSYMCLLLVVVESVDFVHLYLNSKKALRLGISHMGENFDKCPIAENRFTSCLLLII